MAALQGQACMSQLPAEALPQRKLKWLRKLWLVRAELSGCLEPQLDPGPRQNLASHLATGLLPPLHLSHLAGH